MQFNEGTALDGKAGQGVSRDSCVWAICCDEWDKKRRTVISAIERTDRENRRLDVIPKL